MFGKTPRPGGRRSRLPFAASLLAALSVSTTALAADRSSLGNDFSNVPQRLIIQFDTENGRNWANEARVLSLFSGRDLAYVRKLGVERRHVFKLASRADRPRLQALLQRLQGRMGIVSVEEDVLMQPHFTPNDSAYGDQWHYFEATGGINAPAAWDQQTGGGAVVAVIDTGYVYHSDLDANMLPGYDFISDATVANDGGGRDADASDPGDWMEPWDCGFFNPPSFIGSSWHGTHVAGTVAAVTNNSSGVSGVAFDAKVVPVRALGKCGGFLSDIADAVVWASGGSVAGAPANPNPAQVINMSLGGSGACDSTYQAAINAARANGATVVVSAGNSNDNAANYRPASCAGVVSVASNDRQGNRASYSNYGATVDVAAPGGETAQVAANGVLSTLNAGDRSPGAEAYAYYQGTSMAAPHVAGAAALMYASNPSLTPDQVEQALKDTARPLPGSCSGGCGAGIIDANAAVAAVSGGPVNQRPSSDFSFTTNLLTADFTDASSDPDGTLVSWSWDFGDGNGSTLQSPVHSYAANGDYTVTLTVTDDGGATDASSQLVTVNDGSGPTSDGYTEQNLSASRRNWVRRTLEVPAGASQVQFSISGGSGDADLYIRYGSQPTTSSYNCRPYLNGNNETCTFSNPPEGTWHIGIRAYRSFSGVTLDAYWNQ